MASIEEIQAYLTDILAALATRSDLGTWGEPVDYSIVARQDQPAGSGASQYKTEDVPMGENTVLGRGTGAATEIGGIALGEAQLLGRPTAGAVSAVDFSTVAAGGAPAGHHASHEIGGGDLVDHDDLTNFVANEHIDHTAVTLTAGVGLAGGGDISANRSFSVNVDDSTIEIDTDTLRVKDDGVTYAKIQNVTATDRLLGRDTAGAGIVEEIAPVAARTMLNLEDGADVTDATNVGAAGAVMDADFSATEGFMRKSAAGTYTVHKSNLSAAVAPTANEDSGDGYSVGSIWIDTTNDKSYICVDATVANAVWNDLTAGGNGDTHPITDSTAIVKGSVDATKLVRVEADSYIASGQTRVIYMADEDIDLRPGLGDFADSTHDHSGDYAELCYKIVEASDSTQAVADGPADTLFLGGGASNIATAAVGDQILFTIVAGAVDTTQLADDGVTFAKFQNVVANSVMGATAAGNVDDLQVGDVTEEETPATGDFLLGWESGGALRKFDVGDLPGGGGASQLSDLSDVNTSTPTDGNVLRADGVDWESTTLGIDDLGDAVITGTPADDEVLAYNTATSKWINQTASEAFLLRKDGTVGLTANWDAGAFEIFIAGVSNGGFRDCLDLGTGGSADKPVLKFTNSGGTVSLVFNDAFESLEIVGGNLFLPTTAYAFFRDDALYIHSPSDGTLDIIADGSVRIPKLDLSQITHAGTLPAANIGAETVTPAKLSTAAKTITRELFIAKPAADDVVSMGSVPDAATAVAVRSVTESGTVDFNIEKRGKFTPDQAGTDVMAAEQVADDTGEEETTFAGGSTAISADDHLVFVASDISATPPENLWVWIEYTIN